MNLTKIREKQTFMDTNWPLRHLCYVISFSLVLSLVGPVLADKLEDQDMMTAKTESQERFEYILENRSDPFIPFLTAQSRSVKSVDMNEIVEDSRPLTGMQLFEPGQLTLVALINNGSQDIAMVQDFTGKGYILAEGTLIGRYGVVKDIARNNVIIEETATTRAGKKIISEVVMILKKEGEE